MNVDSVGHENTDMILGREHLHGTTMADSVSCDGLKSGIGKNDLQRLNSWVTDESGLSIYLNCSRRRGNSEISGNPAALR